MDVLFQERCREVAFDRLGRLGCNVLSGLEDENKPDKEDDSKGNIQVDLQDFNTDVYFISYAIDRFLYLPCFLIK